MYSLCIVLTLTYLAYTSAENCSADWTEVEGKCLYFSTEKQDYPTAAQTCQTSGGRLFIGKNEAAIETVAASMNSVFWMGISWNAQLLQFEFDDGSNEKVKYTNWAEGQPSNLNGDLTPCVQVEDLDSKWYTDFCAVQKYFVCEDTNDDLEFWSACSDGWDLIQGKCYLKVSSSETFSAAVATCNDNSASLFEPHWNGQENAVFGFYNTPATNFWLGIEKAGGSDYKYNSSGELLEYTNWLKDSSNDEPDGSGNCIVRNNLEEKWIDDDCDGTYEFICQENDAVEDTTCPTDYEMVQGRCIYIEPRRKIPYFNAKRKCSNNGGRLFEPRNSQTNYLIKSKFAGKDYWVGIRDVSGENDFRFETTRPGEIDFTSWNKDEPNKDATDDNCVVVNDRGLWDDIDCRDNKNLYVCEIPSDTNSEFWNAEPIDSMKETLTTYIFKQFLENVESSSDSEEPRKFLSSGGLNITSGSDVNEVYLVDTINNEVCLQSELPLAGAGLQAFVMDNRLMMCRVIVSSFPPTQDNCFIWSENNGWEAFTSNTFSNFVTNPRADYCLVDISDTKTAIIGGNLTSIDVDDKATGTEEVGVANLIIERSYPSCLLLPKGPNGNPTVVVVGGNTFMELWDTVTNEVTSVDHYNSMNFLLPSLVLLDDESFLITNTVDGSSTPVRNYLKYSVSNGWELLDENPDTLADLMANHIYPLTDSSIDGFQNLLQCA